jgi:hypothetical protein
MIESRLELMMFGCPAPAAKCFVVQASTDRLVQSTRTPEDDDEGIGGFHELVAAERQLT